MFVFLQSREWEHGPELAVVASREKMISVYYSGMDNNELDKLISLLQYNLI